MSLDLKYDLNLFGFVFGKMKVLVLYGYMFDKCEG